MTNDHAPQALLIPGDFGFEWESPESSMHHWVDGDAGTVRLED